MTTGSAIERSGVDLFNTLKWHPQRLDTALVGARRFCARASVIETKANQFGSHGLDAPGVDA